MPQTGCRAAGSGGGSRSSSGRSAVHEIFRVGATADAEEGEAVDAAGEAIVELTERRAIAGLCALDECLDVLFMSVRVDAAASVPAAS